MEHIPYFAPEAGPPRRAAAPSPAAPQDAYRPPGWRPPAGDPAAAPPQPLSSRRRESALKSKLPGIAVLVAAIASIAALIVFAVSPGGSKPSVAAVAAAAKADVARMGTAIEGYYAGNDGPLALTTHGVAWVITNVEGDIVASGGFSKPGEVVTSDKLAGPGAWCVALAAQANPKQGWHFAAAGGLQQGSSCR